MERAKAMPETEVEQSLREYYELGISGDEFYVIYKARCDYCGFEFVFRHEQPIGEHVRNCS